MEHVDSSLGFSSPIEPQKTNTSTGLTDQVNKVCLEKLVASEIRLPLNFSETGEKKRKKRLISDVNTSDNPPSTKKLNRKRKSEEVQASPIEVNNPPHAGLSTGLTHELSGLDLDWIREGAFSKLSDSSKTTPKKNRKRQTSVVYSTEDRPSSEKANKKRKNTDALNSEGSDELFVVRQKSKELPGVNIDEHEWKHSENWPAPKRSGGRGSMFPREVTIDEMKEIASSIVRAAGEVFNSRPATPAGQTPKKIQHDVGALVPRSTILGRKLKVAKISQVSTHAGFDSREDTWGFHFFPDHEKKDKR